MTTLEALAGATMVAVAFAGALKYRPGQTSRWWFAAIVILAVAGSGLTVGQLAMDASREAMAAAQHAQSGGK